MTFTPSPQQAAAIRDIVDWYRHRTHQQQVFRLFGYAGSGKSTITAHAIAALDLSIEPHGGRWTAQVLFAAFTGKAALVMRSKGCERASTIHSLIYKTRESGEEVPSFDLWDGAPASKAALIVIDECSMVDAELGRDLKSFGVPLLVLGDPAQLPPIQGGGFFTEAEPDAMLTEVHRQAEDNPIIRLSMDIRAGIDLEPRAVWQKLVHSRRGGYCFEQNSLLLDVLTAVGFAATPLSARVRLQRPRDFTPPRSHMFVRVELDGSLLGGIASNRQRVGGVGHAGEPAAEVALRLPHPVDVEDADEAERAPLSDGDGADPS